LNAVVRHVNDTSTTAHKLQRSMRPIIKANGGTVSYQAGLHGYFVCDAFYHIMGGPSAIPFTFPHSIHLEVWYGVKQ